MGLAVKQIEKHDDYLSTNIKSVLPALVAGNGCRARDLNGKTYLDLCGQTLCLNLGHCFQAIVNAISAQARSLFFASSRFQSLPALRLAKALVKASPSNFSCVNHKLCNGSDAVETALKIARKYSGKHTVLAFKSAWHGESSETIRLCDRYSTEKFDYLGGSRDVIFIDPPHCFRCPFGQNADTCKQLCADHLAAVIGKNKDRLSALIVDPINFNSGLYYNPIHSKEYLRTALNVCEFYGISLIFDEIQSFGGWLNGKLFGADFLSVSPHLMCLGKALGAGLPLAAVLMEERYRNVLSYNEAEYTYGGQAIACAASMASLSLLQNKDFEVGKKGDLIEERLCSISNRTIMDIRRAGLIFGVEFTSEELCRQVYLSCLERGVIFRVSMPLTTKERSGKTLLIKPPIIITEKEIHMAMDVLQAVLDC